MSEDRWISFPEADEPLRRDVSLLGNLLGGVLKEQGGAELFDRVEEARTAAIRHRTAGLPISELQRLLAGHDPTAASELVRAFSAYFSLVNVAEQVHRIRRRRQYALDSQTPQPGSLAAVLQTLGGAGLSTDRVASFARSLTVVPVFTAHPTEATRRTLLTKEHKIANELVDRIERSHRTPLEERLSIRRLQEIIGSAWQTEEQPTVRRTVADEVEHAAFYVSEVLYGVVPTLQEAFEDAFEGTYGTTATPPSVGPLVRFASWVGGDMDGNPNVGADTILTTLERHRQLILERYRRDVRDLFDRLSQSLSRVDVDGAVVDRCREYREMLPEVGCSIPARYDGMPYRTLLWLIWARLEATRDDGDQGYHSADDLQHDLMLIAASLRGHRGRHAGLSRVERLIRKVETFGFHMATLDVRQDALVHRRVVGILIGSPDLSAHAPAERTLALRAALAGDTRPIEDPTGDEVQRTLDVFRAIAVARRRFGEHAIGPYIISMASDADDVLAVLLLARAAGLVDERGRVPLDVAPLFETVDDLNASAATLRSMIDDPQYRRHLSDRGDRQVVMLGYSDSSKISGVAASRWALYRAQEELVVATEAARIELTLFHGRGGTVGRGGSKPRQAVLAEPRGAVRGRLRVTEQGEIINLKYGLEEIAERTLELAVGAVLESTALCDRTPTPVAEWREVMGTVADGARAAYKEIVHDHPDFIAYFRTATPIDVIERMPIGSRPPSRRSGSGVQDLRAIPWVFAWMQSRHLLPGWFGVGDGLAAALESHGEKSLRRMALEWPFFANLLADVEMVLAKADIDIAACYAALAGEVGERFFPIIRDRFQLTRDLVLRLTGESDLLDREPILQRSIRLRNPYVDPMSLVQVDLLRRWRERDRNDPDLEKALFTTVRGIARGLRNTG
jgi:phosphoenolpyruvate carboxylase